jgi:hypothetical protein
VRDSSRNSSSTTTTGSSSNTQQLDHCFEAHVLFSVRLNQVQLRNVLS